MRSDSHHTRSARDSIGCSLARRLYTTVRKLTEQNILEAARRWRGKFGHQSDG